ncbi:MAG: DUF1244 domain-containing protein [Henriciella sp.]|nr:DUF1244 domain-containing protein [Henriciella sp.]
MTSLTQDQQDKLDAAAFRRLLSHLDANKDVQNIDLMILADFCRNCLSDWYMEAAHAEGLEMSKADARTRVYGMPQAEWKEKFQLPASPEQIAAFEARTKGGC